MTKKKQEPVTEPEANSVYDRGEMQLVWVPAGAGQRNPLQWKEHPPEQMRALDELIFGDDGVGWAGAGLLNDRKTSDGWSKERAVPTWLDGHARETLEKLQEGEYMPALVGHWTERNEKVILATLDPSGMLARYDGAIFKKLREEIGPVSATLEAILDDTAAMAGVFDHYNPPTEEELDDTYGPPSEEDSWPVIVVRVPHHIFTIWQDARNAYDDDHKAMTAIMENAKRLLK